MFKGKIKYACYFSKHKRRLAVTEISRLIIFNDPLKNSSVLKRIKYFLKMQRSQSNLCFKFPKFKRDCESGATRTKPVNENITFPWLTVNADLATKERKITCRCGT